MVQAEVDEEIQAHLQMRIDELHAQGMSIEDARRDAVRRFGNIESTRRYCREQDVRRESAMQRRLTLQDLGQDISISLRSLARAPILTLTILLTVGLGIGATTVIFAAIEAAFLRPLPYAHPERLVWIYTDAPPFQFRLSAVDYLALEAQRTRFESIGAFTDRTMTFSEGAGAEVLQGRVVSWLYFRTLGLVPVLGRDFTDLDAKLHTAPGVIVSHAFWQQRLAGRPDATRFADSIGWRGIPAGWRAASACGPPRAPARLLSRRAVRARRHAAVLSPTGSSDA